MASLTLRGDGSLTATGGDATDTKGESFGIATSKALNIEGEPHYNKTLTVKVESANNTGTLSYQWKRGEDVIPNQTGSTDLTQREDITSGKPSLRQSRAPTPSP